jgi:predicted RNase H-like nuclease (RuvC/YqgF family)
VEIGIIMGVDSTGEHHDDDNNESDSNDDEATRSHQRNERLEQNRISARESRKRKKNLIEELQRTVITLSRENKELMERNEGLRRELMDIGTKNPGVVRSC